MWFLMVNLFYLKFNNIAGGICRIIFSDYIKVLDFVDNVDYWLKLLILI